MFACEFYRWVEAIRGEQLLLIECLWLRSEQRLHIGDAPHATRAAEVLCVPGGGRKSWGVPPHLHPALPVAPAELGSPVPAGLHCLCPPALATTTDTHPQLLLIFIFPFYSLLFLFFLPFLFFSRSYQGWVTPGSPTQSICAHSALTCICHSLYTHTFGHVTSISQFAFPLYFILPLVSLCQKKAEGGAVRKTFLL